LRCSHKRRKLRKSDNCTSGEKKSRTRESKLRLKSAGKNKRAKSPKAGRMLEIQKGNSKLYADFSKKICSNGHNISKTQRVAAKSHPIWPGVRRKKHHGGKKSCV